MAVMQRTPVWGDWGSSDDEPARAIVFCKGHASIRAVSLHVFTKRMSADMRTYDASEDIRQNRLTDRPEGNYIYHSVNSALIESHFNLQYLLDLLI